MVTIGVRIPMAPVLMLICLIVVLQATEVAAAAAADYYKTLGLPRSATAQQVKKKYRQMARKYHPDVNKAPGVKEKFQEINKAYEILGDEEKRKQYDQFGDTGDGPMGGGGGGPPGGGRHGSSSFTGTHFDNFYNFGGAGQQPGGGFRPPPDFEFMFQNQQGGGGRRSSQSQQQQGRGRKAKASSSSSSATATSRSTFSFENLFGANAFGSSGGGGDDGNNAKATASRSTTKSSPSWFESMFGGGGGGGGTPPHQEDPSEDTNERRRSSQQQGKSSSNKKKDKKSNGGANPEEYARRFGAKQAPSFKEGGGGGGGRKDKPNMKEEAGDGIPKREDTARFKEMFDETDESSRPPPDMFQGVNSPDDMTPEQSEHFQSWFNKKFSGGGGPGGGGGGPGGGGSGPPPDFASMFGGSKKKKTPKDGKKSQSEDSTPKRKGRDSSSQSEKSTSYEEEKTADKAKSKKKKNAEREEQESSTHSVLEFSPALFNKHCVQLKRRCIFIFGGSTTYLSGKITFRSIAERYASVAVAGKSSPVESRVFFVSRHNVLEADAALRAAMHLDDGDVDTKKSESLCAAYGSASRYGDKAKLAYLAGEHCVVVLSGSGKRYGVIAKYVKGTSGEDAPLVADASQSIRTDADVVKHLERLFNDDSVSSSSGGGDGDDTSKKVFKGKWRRMLSAVRAMEVVQPQS